MVTFPFFRKFLKVDESVRVAWLLANFGYELFRIFPCFDCRTALILFHKIFIYGFSFNCYREKFVVIEQLSYFSSFFVIIAVVR